MRGRLSRSFIGGTLAAVPLAALAAVGAPGVAHAAVCSQGQSPDLSLAQAAGTATGGDVFTETVTNYGNCGATNVVVTFQAPPGTSVTGAGAVSRSWTCVAGSSAGQEVCTLGSSLDATSANSPTGNSGQATVQISTTAPTASGGRTPPDVTASAQVSDTPQIAAPDADDVQWGGAIDPATGGSVTTGLTSFQHNVDNTVTVPSGVGGAVVLTEQTSSTSPTCTQATTGSPPSCDISITVPVISNGYNTVTMQVFSSVAPTSAWYQEGTGQITLAGKCKGSTASPPCLYSIKGYSLNTANPYYLVIVRDSDGSKIWY